MFLFQISNYDDTVLDAETEELLRQRLEAHSRQTVPGMWKLTDSTNAYATKGPGREKRKEGYRIYGILLIALGIFALVPGLMEPRIPTLICGGGLAIFAGVLEFCLVNKKKAPKVPVVCQKEAKSLLEGRRAIDWTKNLVKINFDEAGMTIFSDKVKEIISYDKIKSVFETEHLWLLVYNEKKALLLQKKDLISGHTNEFLPYIRQEISVKQ